MAIIGHSMGGLVARALLTLKNFKHDLINLLVTQATPHVAPVMPLDRFITGEYYYINSNWPPHCCLGLNKSFVATPFRVCYRFIHVWSSLGLNQHFQFWASLFVTFSLRFITETAVRFLCLLHLNLDSMCPTTSRHLSFSLVVLDVDAQSLKCIYISVFC